MMEGEQLGFSGLLADAEAANVQRTFEAETTHLPGEEAEAIAFHRLQIEAHDAAMLECDFALALAIREEAHLLARKLNGGDVGILAHKDAPGYVLAGGCAAPEGEAPLWGQEGCFDVIVEGVVCRIAFEGMFGIGARAITYLGFAARAVARDKPFISSTGYRSFLGAHVDAQPGLTTKGFAEQVIQHFIKTDLRGQLKEIA